jgi:Mn2+/Fe2+ NRAMP family transporter
VCIKMGHATWDRRMKLFITSHGIRTLTLRWVVFAGVANFLIFVLVAMYLGGNALCGGTVAGHYFVCEHGDWTEVSRATFTYSEWHARSIFLTHPLVLICAWLASRKPHH